MNTGLSKATIAVLMAISLTMSGCGGGAGTDLPLVVVDDPVIDTGTDDGTDTSTDDGTDIGSTPDYVPYDAPAIEEATKTAFLDAVNSARAQEQDCGTEGIFPPTGPVEWSDALYRAAYEHSEDMGVVGETSEDISHDGSGGESDWTAQVLELGRGSTPWERGANNGFDNETRYTSAENAHSSPETIETAMKDWLESDGHCVNIMNPDQTHVGVAMVENPDSAWRYYWTQLFGSSK